MKECAPPPTPHPPPLQPIPQHPLIATTSTPSLLTDRQRRIANNDNKGLARSLAVAHMRRLPTSAITPALLYSCRIDEYFARVRVLR